MAETPNETTFLSLLQHLLQIDAGDELGDVIWETVERLVAGASTLIGRRVDAERLLADGTRRLSRAVARPRPRRSERGCSATCQCDCHEDDMNSASAQQSPATSKQSSTATGANTRYCSAEIMLK